MVLAKERGEKTRGEGRNRDPVLREEGGVDFVVSLDLVFSESGQGISLDFGSRH